MSVLVAALAGRYLLDHEVGRGGMAIVYRAQDLKHQRTVALKVLNGALTESGLPRFRREIALASKLQHPHILPLFDSGESAGRLWYTMPFVEGETLGGRLRRERRLAIPEAVRLLREIADGLAHAHAHGVVHRDLKPDNVLLSGEHAVIADFGVAKALAIASQDGAVAELGSPGTDTTAGVSVGTPAYMAPEQAVADPACDHRVDLYALGVIGYQLLAGMPPFRGASPQAVVAAHLTERPSPLSRHRPEVPPSLERLVMQLLEKRAEDRPGSTTQVLAALATVAADAPSGPRRRTSRLIGTAVLAIFLGASLLAVRARRTPPAPAGRLLVQVAAFKDQTGDTAFSQLGLAASGWIEYALSRTTFATVTADTALTSLEVGLTVGGRYVVLGDELRIFFQVTDTARNLVPWGTGSLTVSRATPQSVILDTLAQLILAAFATRYDDRMVEWAMGAAPRNYPALVAFTNGLDQISAGEVQLALESWTRAAALDSTYMQPRLHAAAVLGGPLPEVADTILDGVERRRDHLSDGDLAWLAFDHSGLTGSAEDAFRTANALVRAESGAQLPYFFLAASAVRAYRPKAALEAAKSVSYRFGRFRLAWAGTIYFLTLTEAYHQLGWHEEELRAARTADSLHPENRDLLAAQIRALVALDSLAATEPLLTRLVQARPLPGGLTLAEQLIRIAGEFQVHRHAQVADNLLRQALAQQLALPAIGPAGDTARYDLARIHYLLKEYSEAEHLFQELVDRHPANPSYQAFLGASADRMGRSAVARRVAEILDTLQVPYDHGMTAYARAQLEAQRGDTAAALASLAGSLTRGMPVLGVSIHQDVMLAPLWTSAQFKALQRPRD